MFKLKFYNVAWLAVNKDGRELIFDKKPHRYELLGIWCLYKNTDAPELPKGSIKRLTGHEMKWSDEPLKIIIKKIEAAE